MLSEAKAVTQAFPSPTFLPQAKFPRVQTNKDMATAFISGHGAFLRRAAVNRHLCDVRSARPSRPLTKMVASSTERAKEVVEGPFEGKYGSWNLTRGDVDGVQQYRLSLLASAIPVIIGVLGAQGVLPVSGRGYDLLYAAHTAAFWAALQTIHIYMKPMHNMLKVLWASGVLGAAVVALTAAPHSLVEEVAARPILMMAVGWQFVALTGLFFKESVCFWKKEALGLTALVPIIAGGHFLHIFPERVEMYGMSLFAIMFAIFAARKFTQPAREDIGDMSVFIHLASGGEL